MQAPRLRKILFAEDDADIREIGVMSLESLGGFEVRTCDSGVAVVELARQWGPDLVLMDVMMPKVDGPGALVALRADKDVAHIPVVFMTARVLQSEVERYLAMGAQDVIAKPFDPVTLADTIRDIWSRALGDAASDRG